MIIIISMRVAIIYWSSSAEKILEASDAAVEVGVLVTNSRQSDHYNLLGNRGIWLNIIDAVTHAPELLLLLDVLDADHFVLDAFLEKHLGFWGVAGVLVGIKGEELIWARDFYF